MMPMHRVGMLLLLSAAVSASAAGQVVDSSRASDRRSLNAASPFLPAESWAVAAVRRLDALGLAGDDFAFGDGSLTRHAVGRVLRDAVEKAKREQPQLEPMASMYWSRFAREFRATARALGDSGQQSAAPVEGSVRAGFARQTGRLFPVRVTSGREGIGPFPRADLSEPTGTVGATLLAGRYFVAALEGQYTDERLTFGESHAVVGWRKVAVWAGRRAPAFGPGTGGGLLFSGTAPLAGGGVALTEPVRLPSVLRHMGAIRFEALLARLDSNADIRHPWIVASHASLSPHPRLLVGVTQSFMFGGDGLPPLTFKNFKSLYGGKRLENSTNLAGFENGLASAELRFRPPIPGVPMVLYLEMGAEDTHSDLSSKAPWRVVPARVMGVHFPAIGRSTSLSLGLEHTYFSGPCSGCSYYATWYRHYLFKDGWTANRQPIGHALGGDGREWLASGVWDDVGGRLRVTGRVFRRNRGPYNIYSPLLAGSSTGGRLDGMYQLGSRSRVLFDGSAERTASGVGQSSFFAGAQWVF